MIQTCAIDTTTSTSALQLKFFKILNVARRNKNQWQKVTKQQDVTTD